MPLNNVDPISESGPENSVKTVLTILFLILIYPIGVILMWAWMKWAKWVKVFITAIGCIPLIIGTFFIVFSAIVVIGNPKGGVDMFECKAQCDKNNPNDVLCKNGCENRYLISK